MTGAGGFGSIARLITKGGEHSPPALRSGQVIRAQVLKQIGPSKWMLGIGGRVVAASSERSLGVGGTFMAQVRVQSGTIFLQPYEQVGGRDGAMRFLAAEGLPRDGLSVTIIRAMLRNGVSLDPSRIQNIYAFFNARGEVSPRLVRAYLLMQEKGMEPSAEALEKLVDALDGFSEREGDRHGEGGEGYRRSQHHGRRDFGSGGGSAGSSSEGSSDSHDSESSEDAEDRRAEDTLRELVGRREDEPRHLLQAFNHLSSTGGHWMVVPFSLTDTQHTYEGSLRIHFSLSGEKPSFDRAAVSVTRGGSEQSWSLEIVRPPAGGGGHTRLFYPEGREPPPELFDALRDRLSALGLGPVELRSAGEFDGFSTEEGPDILKGVDTEA
ncbi:MAG: hypothetical protein ACQETQ_00455 [Spirochaetota bacterium]